MTGFFKKKKKHGKEQGLSPEASPRRPAGSMDGGLSRPSPRKYSEASQSSIQPSMGGDRTEELFHSVQGLGRASPARPPQNQQNATQQNATQPKGGPNGYPAQQNPAIQNPMSQPRQFSQSTPLPSTQSFHRQSLSHLGSYHEEPMSVQQREILNTSPGYQQAYAPANFGVATPQTFSQEQGAGGREYAPANFGVVTPQNLASGQGAGGRESPWVAKPLRNSPFPRYRFVHSAATNGGAVFINGGLREDSVFGCTWSLGAVGGEYVASELACAPGTGPLPRVAHCAVLVGNAFIIFGGDTTPLANGELDNELYFFNTSLGRYFVPSHVGHKPQGRYGATLCCVAAPAGSKLYLYGGQLDNSLFDTLSSFELATFKNPHAAWETVQIDHGHRAAPPLADHTMCVYDGRLYVFGGMSPHGLLNELWCFDPERAAWSRVPAAGAVPPPMHLHAATVVGSTMFVFGGETDVGSVSRMYACDLNRGVWRRLAAHLPGEPPLGDAGMGLCFVGASGRLVVFGGDAVHELDLTNLDRFFEPLAARGRTPSAASAASSRHTSESRLGYAGNRASHQPRQLRDSLLARPPLMVHQRSPSAEVSLATDSPLASIIHSVASGSAEAAPVAAAATSNHRYLAFAPLDASTQIYDDDPADAGAAPFSLDARAAPASTGTLQLLSAAALVVMRPRERQSYESASSFGAPLETAHAEHMVASALVPELTAVAAPLGALGSPLVNGPTREGAAAAARLVLNPSNDAVKRLVASITNELAALKLSAQQQMREATSKITSLEAQNRELQRASNASGAGESENGARGENGAGGAASGAPDLRDDLIASLRRQLDERSAAEFAAPSAAERSAAPPAAEVSAASAASVAFAASAAQLLPPLNEQLEGLRALNDVVKTQEASIAALRSSVRDQAAVVQEAAAWRAKYEALQAEGDGEAVMALTAKVDALLAEHQQRAASLEDAVQASAQALAALKVEHAAVQTQLVAARKFETSYREALASVKNTSRALSVTQEELRKQRDANAKLAREVEQLKLKGPRNGSRVNTPLGSAASDGGAPDAALGSEDEGFEAGRFGMRISDLEADLVIVQEERDRLKSEVVALKKQVMRMN